MSSAKPERTNSVLSFLAFPEILILNGTKNSFASAAIFFLFFVGKG